MKRKHSEPTHNCERNWKFREVQKNSAELENWLLIISCVKSNAFWLCSYASFQITFANQLFGYWFHLISYMLFGSSKDSYRAWGTTSSYCIQHLGLWNQPRILTGSQVQRRNKMNMKVDSLSIVRLIFNCNYLSAEDKSKHNCRSVHWLSPAPTSPPLEVIRQRSRLVYRIALIQTLELIPVSSPLSWV